MVRRILRSLDIHVLSRLPARMQLLIKRTLVDIARRLAPGLIPKHVPDGALIRYREPHRESQRLPEWAIEEIKRISLDCSEELYAGAYLSRTVECHHTPFHRAAAGHAYRRIADSMPLPTKAVLVCGDLGDPRNTAQWHARVLSEAYGQSLVVLMTDGRSEYLERLGEHLDLTVIDMEVATAALHHSPHDRLMVLTHLILQVRPPMVHVIGSRLGYDMILHYAGQLSAHTKLFVSPPTCEWEDSWPPAASLQTEAASIVCHSSSVADWLRAHPSDCQERLHIVPAPPSGNRVCIPFLQDSEEWRRFKDGVALIAGYLGQHCMGEDLTASPTAAPEGERWPVQYTDMNAT